MVTFQHNLQSIKIVLAIWLFLFHSASLYNTSLRDKRWVQVILTDETYVDAMMQTEIAQQPRLDNEVFASTVQVSRVDSERVNLTSDKKITLRICDV